MALIYGKDKDKKKKTLAKTQMKNAKKSFKAVKKSYRSRKKA
tara:strand:- start:113 stop:238 length:126 start_codon:yes stop_codon:yes gene_type:complete